MRRLMVRSLAALVCMIMYHQTRYWIALDAFIRKKACWIKWFHCSNRVLYKNQSTSLCLLAYLSIKMSTTTTMTLSLTSIRMEELQQQNHSVHLLWSRKLLNFTCWHGHLKGLTHFWSLPREDYERTTVLFFCCCFFHLSLVSFFQP